MFVSYTSEITIIEKNEPIGTEFLPQTLIF